MQQTGKTRGRLCLWCKAALPDLLESTIQCEHCGRRNRKEDLAIFHTLHPRARRLQTAVEIASALVLAGCVVASMIYWRHLKGGEPHIVLGVLLPAALAMTIGYQSRFITRRSDGAWRGVTPASCGSVALVALVYVVFLSQTMTDLEGGALYTVLAIAGVVVLGMGYRVWATITRRRAH